MIEIVLPKTQTEDIIPLTAGKHVCPASHSFGPHVRDCYVIHFCLSGKGVLYNQRGEHRVEAGDLFIIRPNEITTYTASPTDPWRYVWITFIGKQSGIFNSDTDVYRSPRVLTDRLNEYVEAGVRSPEIYMSVLYELIYELFTKTSEPQDRLTEIKRYVKYEYMKPLSVGELARMFGFERSYLYRLFKDRYGKSVKEYLTEVRMEHARALLEGGHSVTSTAQMVGYGDEFNFSKAYKLYYGHPPSKTKK